VQLLFQREQREDVELANVLPLVASSAQRDH
jgi:hypothetical protein